MQAMFDQFFRNIDGIFDEGWIVIWLLDDF